MHMMQRGVGVQPYPSDCDGVWKNSPSAPWVLLPVTLPLSRVGPWVLPSETSLLS